MVRHSSPLSGECLEPRRLLTGTVFTVESILMEYEDDLVGNSTWEEGDWNADGEFDTSDLVLAFQSGN